MGGITVPPTYIAPNSNIVTFPASESIYDIRDYGAAIDGVTDDSSAVTAAFAAALETAGGTIYFPPGTTRLSSAMTFDPTADVQGQYVLAGSGSDSVILFKSCGGNIPLYMTNCGSVTVRDLAFVGDSTAGASTTVVDGTTAFLYITYTWKAVIERCFFYGIATSTNSLGVVGCAYTDLVIRDCLFAGCTTPNSGVLTVQLNHNLEMNNVMFIDLYEKFNNVTYSKLAGAGSTKHWVRFMTPVVNVGYVEPTLRIKNCGFDENTTDCLLSLTGRADMALDIENISMNSGIDPPTTVGLEATTFGKASFRNVWAGYCPGVNSSLVLTDIAQVEIDMLLHDAGATDIKLLGTTKRLWMRNCQDVTITNTAGAFIDADQAMPATASAAALAPKGKVTHVTGTDAVTSITATNFKAGDTLTLIFDDALTFTDGNNLKLAGNFSTGADDTISLAFDGTNFYEVARSVN